MQRNNAHVNILPRRVRAYPWHILGGACQAHVGFGDGELFARRLDGFLQRVSRARFQLYRFARFHVTVPKTDAGFRADSPAIYNPSNEQHVHRM